MSSTSTAGAVLGSTTHSGDRSRGSVSNAPSPTAVSSDLTPAPEADTEHAANGPPSSAQYNTGTDDATDSADAAAGYGTRSRNRPRGARPNYADDKEIDLEIEASGKYPKAPKKSSASAALVASTQTQDMHAQSPRNGFAAVNGTAAAPSSGNATPVPNGTHGPVQPATSASKKRKQPGSGTTVQSSPAPPVESRPFTTSRAQFIASNMMSFSKSRKRLNNKGQLVADDGTTVSVNDHCYFLCEPPGEPYYFGRIMEFLHVSNDSSNPVEAVRVNWFYRPKDINRRVQDTRVVFASMHSDICPLSQLRGKCTIQHLNDIQDLDEFRKQPNSFWFDKLFDRYMHRYYEVIPTSKVVNVPRHVKKVLDERWKFVLFEVGRGRELTSASKVCKRCQDFAANNDSVDCAHCKNTYHMSCVRPPLLKKPARGFAWSCAPCARAQELKMEARHTPMSENELSKLAEAESFDDEEDDILPTDQVTRENSTGPEAHPEPTPAQLAHANLWLWRYLGIHSKPEDALDYDDRIYPRASSRMGPRHQANVTVWHGHPIEFIKPAEAKKKYKPTVSHKKDAKSASLLENDSRPRRPKWVVDEPQGYVPRGQDDPVEIKNKKEYTAQLIFKMPDPSKFTARGLDDGEQPTNYDEIVDHYLVRCDQEIAPLFGLEKGNVDIRTKGLEKLQENSYDVEKALEAMKKLSAKVDLKLPELNKEEIRRFEEGVAIYGSQLHDVARHVSPNIKESRIVRFYYIWKKTSRGKEIWGNFENRKSKKDSKRVEKDANGAKLLDDIGDDADDSAFDDEKATRIKRGFRCKHCHTTSSRVWRRAPATAPGTLVPVDGGSKNVKDKSNWQILALCGKCAYLWRRYAVHYESIGELANKISISGGRASKRKVDEELMRIVVEAHNFAGDVISKEAAKAAASAGIDVPFDMVESEEPPKKKVKADAPPSTAPEVVVEKKKLVPEKPVELEPLKPEMPRVKEHPCAVCHIINHPDHRMLKCRDCRLHVHAPCYGVSIPIEGGPWYCDMCKNDHNTLVSTNYECVLCPVRRTPQELMEPPKVSHKKKTDREREKERAEREMVQEAGRRWREDQLAAGRPVDPREPLKRTAWNNWVHVNCAVWTKEIKFGDADHLDAAEGIGFIPRERYQVPCKFCTDTQYPTISCSFPSCNNTFHVGCAHQRNLILGFDVTPVKVSRRDSVPIIKLDQESGLAVPGIWCSHHAITTNVHNMLELTPSGFTALQEYVRTYKQVDNSVTGTVRRAAQFQNNFQLVTTTGQPAQRRVSAVNGQVQQNGQADPVTHNTARSPSPLSPQVNGHGHGASACPRPGDASIKSEKRCCTCAVEHSPKWWKVGKDAPAKSISPEVQQTGGPRLVSENPSLRASNSVQPPSPEMRQNIAPGIPAQSPATTTWNVKNEPIDVDTMTVPEEVLFQCHKCHVNKKTPPSSPSQARRREVPPSVPDQLAQGPTYAAPPPAPNPLTHPLDGPPHAHPGIHPAAALPSLYQTSRPPYAGQPILNGAPPAHPAVVYGAPPYARPEFRYPYPAPVHYPMASAIPLPGAQPNGLPQHSPPPGPYAHPHPLSAQPPPPGPSQPLSPHLGAYGHRPPSYAPPPPAPPHRAPSTSNVPLSGQSIEQPPPSRRPSEGNISTPQMGMNRPSAVPESPRPPHLGQPREGTPRESDSAKDRDRRGSTAGAGASASPSLRNLLS